MSKARNGAKSRRFSTQRSSVQGSPEKQRNSLGPDTSANLDVGSPATASPFSDAVTADFAGTLSEPLAPALIPSVPTPADAAAANASLNNGRLEVVFVDTSVANYQALEASIRPGVEIVEIQPGASGLAQMAAWAGTHSDYDSIQILSHGAEGMIQIGADSLVDANLSSPTVRAELAAIGAALKPDGNILLFGCNVAAGADGQQFIVDLAINTGAVVAASTDETGSADLGGNWTLAAATGVVTAQSAVLPSVNTSWEGLLAISTTGLVANIYENGENTGGVTEAPNVYQQYTYTFTASTSSTQLSFLFREDPDYWSFDDVSLTAANSSTNLIANPGFENGAVATTNGTSQPNSWSLIGSLGLTAAGVLTEGGQHSGSWCWYDGALNGFDGLAQTVATVSGTTYTLKFWLESSGSANNGLLSGIQAPTTSPDTTSSDVTQFLVYEGTLPGGLTVTPPSPLPGAPTVTHIDGSTTITSDANDRPVITGLASSSTPSGSTITVYADGTQIGATTTSDSGGDWSFTPTTALADGSHFITATETVSGTGTSAASNGYSISIVTPPTVTGADGLANHTDDNSKPAINGTAAASSPTGTTITVYFDGTAVGTTTTSDIAGDWSVHPVRRAFRRQPHNSRDRDDRFGRLQHGVQLCTDNLHATGHHRYQCRIL